MTRAELLAAANAALRLGDFFVPPRGTRVRWYSSGGVWEAVVDVGSSCSTEVRVIAAENWDHNPDPPAYLWVDGNDRLELLDFDRVEGELSPLEDWPRPTAEDFNRSVGAERWRR